MKEKDWRQQQQQEQKQPYDLKHSFLQVAPRLFSEMVPKSPNKTSKGAAGVMAKTPLDKKSRYFTGKHVLSGAANGVGWFC